jgi:Ni/Co efflux regulator RcnB
MLEWLTNPWVIIIIVVSVVVGNIAALKQTANMDLGKTSRSKRESDLDKLNRLEKQNQEKAQSKETKGS